MKIYFRLLAFAKPYSRFVPKYAFLAVFGVLFGVVNFSLIIPLLNVLFGTFEIKRNLILPDFYLGVNYFKEVFNFYFNFIIIKYNKTGALQFVCLVILTCVFLANLFKYWSERVMTSMRTYVVKNIRKSLFLKFSTLHMGYFNTNKKGDLMSSISSDVHEIENSVVSSIQVIFKEPLLLIAFFIMLFNLSFELTLFTILFLPVSGLIIASLSKMLRKESSRGQGLLGSILSITDEAIGGSRIIKAFNAQKYVQQKFEEQNDDYTRLTKSILNKKNLASPISEFLGVMVVIGVLVYGGKMVLEKQSNLSASEFITYIILYSQVLGPAKSIAAAITNIQRGLAAGERVLKIIDTPDAIKEHENAVSILNFKNDISYKNASFSYETTPVLKTINFNIPKGKVVALVGQSGSGKSTLADLLPRFYDVQSGEILIDGINIQNYKLEDLRGLMGIVTQESILFNDSIFNNIAFGFGHATIEAVTAAAKVANAHEFITQMEFGYQTHIGDRGGKLSGGQRQRISIARAVLKNPPILILDEATSALDTESERLVQDALIKLMENRTSIIIAHRLSTIQHADEIIVLSKGEIIERGKHAELFAQGGFYKKLCDMQAFY
jgi:subfamily B ATP-binding cassette protein MsbA